MASFDILERFYYDLILIPYHEHPLMHCYLSFTCDQCHKGKGEGWSFICTYCNYNCCEDCFKKLELYKILFYHPTDEKQEKFKKKFVQESLQDFSDLKFEVFKCENKCEEKHALPLIKEGSANFDWIWICSNCKITYHTYESEEHDNLLYYCSICNYMLCLECAYKIKPELKEKNQVF